MASVEVEPAEVHVVEVHWTGVATGTHSGAPFSPLPGVPPVGRMAPSRRCENDAEAFSIEIGAAGLLNKLSVHALPGGRGFSGPAGFFVQMGGDAASLPVPDAPKFNPAFY